MNLRVAGVLVLTACCLLFVLWGLDPAEVQHSLSAAHWDGVAVVMLLYFAAHFLRVLRLRVLLGQPVGRLRLLSILSVGYLAIQVVPFRMGEFVRPYLLMEREKIPFGTALAAILLERLADMLLLLCMFLWVAWGIALPGGKLELNGVDLLVAGQRLIGGLTLTGLLGVGVLSVVGEPLLRYTDRLPVAALIRRFYEGIQLMRQQPWRMVQVLALSGVIWALTILGVWVMLRSFPGMPESLESAFVVWTITLTGMTVVPTPGFFGGFEAACTAALMIYGTPLDAGRTFALVLHLSQFLFTIGLGGGFLLWEGLSLAEVVGRSRAAAQKGPQSS